MPLHFFHKFGDTNGNSFINAFEDWFAAQGFDIGAPPFLAFANNAANRGAPLTGVEGPLEAAATAVPAHSPLQYFIKIDGVTGDATLKGFEGWIAVDGFDVGVQNTASVGSASGGAGAGKASFSPLTVDIHSLAALAPLFSDAARGQNLGTVELAAVETIKGQALKVYDLKLSDVAVSSFENDPGPNGIETAVAFDFAKASVTVQPPTNNGRPGIPQTGAFDLTTLKAADTVASDFSASAVTTTQLASAARPVPANSPLQYFIKIDGVTGDTTLKGFEGWIAVDGFDWGAQNTTAIASSGAGAGKTTFSPLTVDIHSLSGLTALFSDAARGENLGTVELAAVDTIRGQALKVYDLKLSDVLVSSFANDPGPNGIETAVAFDFAKASVTVQPTTNNGRPGVPQTGEFDLTTLKAADAVATDFSASAVTTIQVSLASAATPVPANSPLQYFIKVDNVTGDATLKGFEGWIAVDGFDWGAQNTTSVGNASGGAGAGKTSFSPLTVDIHSLSGLASLFSDAARGQDLGTVELAAVDTVRGQALKVYDLKLSDVLVSSFANDPGPNGIETALVFDFAKASVTVQPTTSNGRPGVPQTGTFDLTTLKAADAIASDVSASAVTATQVPLASAATPVPANSPLQYFIKVGGVTGDATLKGFEGWIAVDGFDWGAQNTASAGSASTGAGAGKTSFSPLTVDIHSLSGLAALFTDAARGQDLGTVELAAVDTVRGQALKVYDLKLSDVLVSSFANDPGPNGIETALAFDFAKVDVTVQPTTNNGRPGVPQTGEFDLTTLKAADAIASDVSANAVATIQATTNVSLASAATAVPANSPLEYFIKIDGITGDATLKGFEGWIAVDGFDWGAQNTTAIASSGAGAGKTTFSPLTVDIHSLSGLASLFSDAARGENLGTVELAAVDTVRGQALKVYDLKLSDVLVSGFENDPGPNGIETALAFDFAKASVTVQPTTNDGRPGVPQTGAFDLTTLKAADAVASDFSASVVTTTQVSVNHVSLASAATPVPANSPLQYFLKVDGATGDATLKGFEGWFSVDGFDWGVQNTTSVGSASSGAGAGKASFSPLTVDIHSLSGVAALFSDATRGDNLGTVELAAVDTARGQALKVFDIKLSDVALTGFENDPGAHGIETALGFDFAKASVTVQSQTRNGQPGVPQTTDVDLTTLKAAFSPSDLVFDPASSGAGLLAPASIGPMTPQDPAWQPTLTSAHT